MGVVALKRMQTSGLRTGLLAVLVAAGLTAFTPAKDLKATEAGMDAPDPLSFKVMRDGSNIGSHSISFEEVGEELHVDIAIDLKVNLAFITVFRYEHRNKEIWRDGRLVSLESRTYDDGDEYFVSARATDEGLLVENKEGSFVAPGDILPTSYWNPATVEQDQLLDTQRGRLLAVSTNPKGLDEVLAAEQRLPAKKFDLNGDLDADLWYAPGGEWMKIAFTARGATIDYVPVGPHRGLVDNQQSSLQ